MRARRAAARPAVTGQGDLFDAPPPASVTAIPSRPARDPAALDPAMFGDDDLIRALPVAIGAACRPLIEAAGHRRLRAAVSALDALCRHFKGFGASHPVMEQTAALRALAQIGGWDAARTVAGLIADDIVQPPGLPAAIAAAARLGCRVPPAITLRLLGHADPAVRTDAALSAAVSDAAVATALAGLLRDPDPAVAQAVAQTLGRHGRTTARPALIDWLHAAPTAETIAAAAVVADETIIVLLGRIARTRPDLADAALDALAEIDDTRAADLLARLRPAAG